MKTNKSEKSLLEVDNINKKNENKVKLSETKMFFTRGNLAGIERTGFLMVKEIDSLFFDSSIKALIVRTKGRQFCFPLDVPEDKLRKLCVLFKKLKKKQNYFLEDADALFSTLSEVKAKSENLVKIDDVEKKEQVEPSQEVLEGKETLIDDAKNENTLMQTENDTQEKNELLSALEEVHDASIQDKEIKIVDAINKDTLFNEKKETPTKRKKGLFGLKKEKSD